MPVDEVVERVFGVDLHLVAVTLARVTYLLAIGQAADRPSSLRRPRLPRRHRPVEPGRDVARRRGITVHTTDGAELFARQLHFPESVVADAGSFDRLVADLADRAGARERGSRPLPAIAAVLNRYRVEEPGRLPDHRRPWADAARAITVQEGAASVAEDAPGSPYEARFRNGATIYPRVLLFVERASAGPLGVPVGVRRVRSARSALDKPPWKHLQSLEEAVEECFILPIHLGSTNTPYRALDPVEAVIPWIGDRLLDDDDPVLDDIHGLAAWWTRAVSLWELHRSERSTL